MKAMILIALATMLAIPAVASERACRRVTVLRALVSIDRDKVPKNELREMRQLYRLVCNNINPQSDIYYNNGVKAYSVKANDWYYPSDQFALLANGRGDVKYPNGIKAYSKKANDWYYPSNVLAFVEEALLPGTRYPLYYPNKLKAFSEKELDWFYPSNKLAFLHRALVKNGSEDMFYPNGVKAYSKRQDDWHDPDDNFVFDDDGSNKLMTLAELSDARMPRFEMRRMRKLRIMLVLDRIDREFR